MQSEHQAEFRDREHAGQLLAAELAHLAGSDPLVLGILRGGLPVAAQVARALDAELGASVARKLALPGHPEVAIGALTADGGVFIREGALAEFHISEDQLAAELELKRFEAAERQAALPVRRPAAEGRTVVLVDDGLATGATMIAAARALRREGAARLIAAIPVGAPASCEALAYEVDELVCPLRPPGFRAVGYHYADFRPTSMGEVHDLLRQSGRNRSL